ncbi:peptide/nickel transport system ATP-binding protein [Loktanella fryxellensis]|uniref:Peptide/nickel transport system ATP-binding protein n=1 Tax=Loktanella fryxellensis TaxID=245187 RepID=A0A1H8BT24_9RHOB|nr:ABC transporter ATP-binding protein [Loktanella fryxellensis]SEM85926.1 peptide/nickel transport system ATP-binding protein [Loktanella fryxellensis]
MIAAHDVAPAHLPDTTPPEPQVLFELVEVEKVFMVRKPGSLFGGAKVGLPALDGVRLKIRKGASVALVGESGSGKSTLLRVLLGLTRPTQGHALYQGRPIDQVRAEGPAFARQVAMIYQDARGSLNPRMTIAALIAEPLRHFRICPEADIPDRVHSLLARVGLPAEVADRYPAAMSGGQVRRVAIARALASEPTVLVADEAVSGLDVSTQAQLLNLLRRLQRDMALTLVFITHDLGVASYLCEEIAIMYLGRIVETGPTNAVLTAPAHPYARALRRAAPEFFAPISDPLPGEIPSPLDLPTGCRFSGRCDVAQADCHLSDPALVRLGGGASDRAAACFHPLLPDANTDLGHTTATHLKRDIHA